MQIKIILCFLTGFIFNLDSFSQEGRFSFEFSASYGNYKTKDILGNAGNFNLDSLSENTGWWSITGVQSDVEVKADRKLGLNIIGKARLIQRKNWNYIIGLGLNYQQFDLKTYSLQLSNLNNELSTFENNNLVYLSLVPMEWQLHLFSKRVSVFVNANAQFMVWSARYFRGGVLDPINDHSSSAFNNVLLNFSGGLNFQITKNLGLIASYQKGMTNIYYKKSRNIDTKADFLSLGLSFQI